MRAVGDDPALLQDDDAVRPANLRKPMRDQNRSASFLGAAHRFLYLVLGGAVNGAGGIIEDQNPRLPQECARQSQPLPLPTGQGNAALADFALISLVES